MYTVEHDTRPTAPHINKREKRLREINIKCPKSKLIRICLKESFHREKKD
jgi:hypothetical protein